MIMKKKSDIRMKRSDSIIAAIIIGIILIVFATVLKVVLGALGFFGYVNPAERFIRKLETDSALEEKYPGHDFDVETKLALGEYGYSFNIYATDENGIRFWVQWVEDEIQDHYHDEWNEYYYGKKLVEYQNSLRDELFPQIPYVDTYEYYKYDTYHFYAGPYKEVFFETMDDAIEGSKSCSFNTDVTFKGIDLYTADEDEIERFAESMADSLMWLYEETGYRDIRINNFSYRKYDDEGQIYETRDELVESIIKNIKLDRDLAEKRKKREESTEQK